MSDYILPGEPPPMKPGEVDEWRNQILEASRAMVDDTRIRIRRQNHIEVVAHGVTVMRDEIVRLTAERDAATATVAALLHEYIGITPGATVAGMTAEVWAKAEGMLKERDAYRDAFDNAVRMMDDTRAAQMLLNRLRGSLGEGEK